MGHSSKGDVSSEPPCFSQLRFIVLVFIFYFFVHIGGQMGREPLKKKKKRKRKRLCL